MRRARSRMREILHRFVREQRSERTGETYGSVSESFLAFTRDTRRPERRDIERFLDRRAARDGRRPSPSTYNRELSALRKFAAYAIRERSWTEDPTAGVAFKPVPETDATVLFVPEVQDFFRAIPHVSPPSQQVRDRALLALYFLNGLRLTEVERLNVAQIDLRTATALRVVRKGERVQDIPLSTVAMYLLCDWLESARSQMAKPGERALFVSRLGTRLSGRSIERLFERLRVHVGTPKHVTPHTARHSFVTNELLLGAEITVVSHAAGHASIRTTMRYRHLATAEARNAIELLGVMVPPELVPEELRSRSAPAKCLGFLGSCTAPAPEKPANDPLDGEWHFDDVGSV